MQTFRIRNIKAQAREILQDTRPDYRRLVLLHGAVSVGVLLLISLLQYGITLLDSTSGGLDGIATGALLKTAYSVLSTGANIVLPFWELGILFTSLLIVRKQQAGFPMLTQGFRRFAPLLRYAILMALILLAVAIGCSYIISIYTIVVPMSPSLQNFFLTFAQAGAVDPYALMDSVPAEFWDYMAKPLILYAVIYTAIITPLAYRFRMAQYVILDGECVGARMSMGISNRLTKGYKWSLCKLDLSFWWYYLLQGLILSVASIPAEITDNALIILICYGISNLLSLVLVYFAGAYMHTSYACAYEFLQARQRELSVIPDMSVSQPPLTTTPLNLSDHQD